MGKWLTENWFNLLNAVGVIAGLFFTAISLRSETKTRKISNLLTMTSNHREVWKELLNRPHLARVLDASVDVAKQPVTPEEWKFVNFVVLHTSSMYEALKDELVTNQHGLRRDVGTFFSLPIPHAVWERTRLFQNEDFAVFVESCREE